MKNKFCTLQTFNLLKLARKEDGHSGGIYRSQSKLCRGFRMFRIHTFINRYLLISFIL